MLKQGLMESGFEEFDVEEKETGPKVFGTEVACVDFGGGRRWKRIAAGLLGAQRHQLPQRLDSRLRY